MQIVKIFLSCIMKDQVFTTVIFGYARPTGRRPLKAFFKIFRIQIDKTDWSVITSIVCKIKGCFVYYQWIIYKNTTVEEESMT